MTGPDVEQGRSALPEAGAEPTRDPPGDAAPLPGGRDGGVEVTILLAEDNAADVRLLQEALRANRIHNELHVVRDGVQALAFLRREPPYALAPVPRLLLLDLNMPRKDGREVLREIKADPVLRRLPVVVLTSSQFEEDIVRAYDDHANCYVRKPVDFERLRQVVREIHSFWFSIVELPPTPAGPPGNAAPSSEDRWGLTRPHGRPAPSVGASVGAPDREGGER